MTEKASPSMISAATTAPSGSDTLIATVPALEALCQQLQEASIIAFDTEFIRETTFYPTLGLIQMATEEKTWLVDPLAFTEAEMAPLVAIFMNPKILKILHAAQGDQECLFVNFGITASPTLDTALAASLLGYGDNIGLAKLLKDVLNVNLQKGHARTDWTARPLQQQLLKYAHADVVHLVKLAKKLFAELEKLGRKEWALEISQKWERREAFQNGAENLALRFAKGGRLDRRAFAAVRELLKWRDQRAGSLNIPRRRVADDDVLLDLAQVRPASLDHLSSFRGLNKGELRTSGEALLAIFKTINAIADQDLPEVPRPDLPSQREARVMDILQCFLKILADKHQIAARHLLASDDMLDLLRHRLEKPEDFVTAGILTPGSCRLIGEELLAILQGRRGLSIKGSEVHLKDL